MKFYKNAFNIRDSACSSLSIIASTSRLEPMVHTPLRLQVSYCSPFIVMCDVASTAVFFFFCIESIGRFPGIVYRYL